MSRTRLLQQLLLSCASQRIGVETHCKHICARPIKLMCCCCCC
jgi:hypothetical protein